jgi:4-hydroxy-tetrahydrodipicolinate reductase
MARVVISGAAGRMGRRLLDLLQHDPDATLVAALEAAGHPALGETVASLCGGSPAGTGAGVRLAAEPAAGLAADVVIDFSTPGQAVRLSRLAAERGWAMVVGTTGLDAVAQQALEEASSRVPVLAAPNYSVGMNVVFDLAAEAARRLGPDYDVEIVESHHRFKKDAPSGTALRLASRVAAATGRDLAADAVYGRRGQTAERRAGEIGIHALRRGDVVGEHSVTLTCLGETVEIVHRAHSRDAFALGAIRAAKGLVGRAPGRYTLEQVLLA